jgi:hypothetical protein
MEPSIRDRSARKMCQDLRGCCGCSVDCQIADPDHAAVGLIKLVQRPQQCRLAGAGRPDDRNVITIGDIEVDAVKHSGFAEAFGQSTDAGHRASAVFNWSSSRLC